MVKKVLFAGSFPGSAGALAPVIRQIKEEGRLEGIVVACGSSEKVFERNSIDYHKINEYGFEKPSLDAMEEVVERTRPDLILTGAVSQNSENPALIEQNAVLAGKMRNIPTISVLDFWGNYWQNFSDVYSGEKFKFLPDKIAVIDNFSLESMVKEGFPKNRLVITGNPYFDDLIESKESFTMEEFKKVRNDLKIDLSSYLILFASQPLEVDFGLRFGYTEKTVLSDLLDSLERIRKPEKGRTLLVKVHPREKKEDIESICKNYKEKIIIDKEYNTRKAALASDLVTSMFSTVLIESTHLDKPSLSLQPGLRGEDVLVTNSLDVTIPVYRKEEIPGVLEKIMFDKDYQEEIAERRKKFSTDGKATQRVKELVYQTLNLGQS